VGKPAGAGQSFAQRELALEHFQRPAAEADLPILAGLGSGRSPSLGPTPW
jgi:hypothetical protein